MQAKRIWEALQGYPARGRARRGYESREYVSRWDATGWGNVLMLTCSLSSADSESRSAVAEGTMRATRGAPRSPLFFGMESSPYANGASGVKLDESANLAPASTTRRPPRPPSLVTLEVLSAPEFGSVHPSPYPLA